MKMLARVLVALALLCGGLAPSYAQYSTISPPPQSRSMPVVAFVGDSIQYAAIGANTATGTYNTGRGPSYWARFLSNQRISSPQSLNFGVAGDTTSLLLARMGPILASGATDFYVMIGTNDIGSVAPATTMANLTLIWRQLLATGARVHASTILPRTLASAASRNQILQINNFIRAQQFVLSRFDVSDPALNYGDPTATDMSPRTDYSYDGLHPKALGAYYSTLPLVTQLNQLYTPFVGPPLFTVTDVYDATDNPSGNLVTNGLMAGTGGTNGAGGGTITGSIADSWTLAHSANGGTVTSLTTTASKVTLADGRAAQRLVISGTYVGAGTATINAGTAVIFRQDLGSLNSTNYPVGSQIAFGASIAVAAGNVNIAGIECQIATTIGGTTYTIGDGSTYTGDLLPAEAFSGQCLTPAFTIPSGSITLMRVGVRIYLRTATGSAASDLTITGAKLAHP